MQTGETNGKVFVVDTNLFFVKRLSEALRQQGFEAVHCSEAAYALTMIEWNMPVAILCAINFNNSVGFEIPSILRADPKTSHIPVIAIGDRGQQSQLEALRAGYADVVDRRLGAEEMAAHLISLLSSHRDGFQPTQMLARSETALDGRLSLVDLPGVIQVLSQSRQTGGLHINADTADGIIFFDAGEIIHAESGQFAGDDAIVHLVKSCYLTKDGVYKFIPGDTATLRTVQGTLNALILDALRQLDEKERDTQAETPQENETPPEPQPQEFETEMEKDHPAAVSEQPVDLPGEAESEKETGTEPLVEIEAEAWPEIDAEAGVVIGEETVTSDDGPCRVEGQEHIPETGNDPAPSPDVSAYESIIDEDTLRELNDLLSGLKVEEQESHE
jgi:CheY-like chemotaxis protein